MASYRKFVWYHPQTFAEKIAREKKVCDGSVASWFGQQAGYVWVDLVLPSKWSCLT